MVQEIKVSGHRGLMVNEDLHIGHLRRFADEHGGNIKAKYIDKQLVIYSSKKKAGRNPVRSSKKQNDAAAALHQVLTNTFGNKVADTVMKKFDEFDTAYLNKHVIRWAQKTGAELKLQQLDYLQALEDDDEDSIYDNPDEVHLKEEHSNPGGRVLPEEGSGVTGLEHAVGWLWPNNSSEELPNDAQSADGTKEAYLKQEHSNAGGQALPEEGSGVTGLEHAVGWLWPNNSSEELPNDAQSADGTKEAHLKEEHPNAGGQVLPEGDNAVDNDPPAKIDVNVAKPDLPPKPE